MTEAAKPPRPPPRPSAPEAPAVSGPAPGAGTISPDTISAVTAPRPAHESIPEAATDSAGAPPPPSRLDAYIGKVIDGRYAVERLLGEGGMGMVFAARHKMI